MKIKKIALGAVCMALLVVSAGCKTETTSQNGITAVTVWTGDGGTKAFMQKEIEQWNNTVGKQQGIRIDYTVQEGSMNEKLDLAFSSGKAPDLFTGGNMALLAANNYIAPFDDMPGGRELIDKNQA